MSSAKELYRLAVGLSIFALLAGIAMGAFPKDAFGGALAWVLTIALFFSTTLVLLVAGTLRRLTPTGVLGGAIGGILLGSLFGFLVAAGGFLLALILVGVWETRRGVRSS